MRKEILSTFVLMIPRETIDEIKARADLLEVVVRLKLLIAHIC